MDWSNPETIAEWRRRVRENLDACALARPLSHDDVVWVERAVSKQMEAEDLWRAVH
jgi:hypothetical protein